MRKNDSRLIFHWAMYDWANSAYATAGLATLLPIYFASVVVPEGGLVVMGRTIPAASAWGYLTGSWALLLFLATPILGAIADTAGMKRHFLAVFAITGASAATLLALQGPGSAGPFVTLFLVAQIGFVSANVFYDAFLPDLTTPDTIDRVSARGYALGYAAGAFVLGAALVIVRMRDSLGLDGAGAARAGILLAAGWWLVFGLLAVRGLAETRPRPARRPSWPTLVRYGVGRPWRTLVRLRHAPHMLLFLVAYAVYNDGVQAMNNMASVYATETLRLAQDAVLATFLASQFSALPGALLFGAAAARIGPKRAIQVTLSLWLAVALAAATLQPGLAGGFMAVGVLAGFAQGGNQALSRSLYGSMIPEAASAEYFGFYSVFAKFSAIWGPLGFAFVSQVTGSPRMGVLSIAALFILGGLLLSRVDIDAARSQAAQV